MGVGEHAVDRVVVRAFLQALVELQITLLAVGPTEPDLDALQRQLDEARGSRTDLIEARYHRREIGAEDYAAVLSKVDVQIGDIEHQITAARGPQWRDFGDEWWLGDNPQLIWDDFDILTKRDMLASWINRVEILPAAHKGARFDTGRVKISWRPEFDPATFEDRLIEGEFGEMNNIIPIEPWPEDTEGRGP